MDGLRHRGLDGSMPGFPFDRAAPQREHVPHIVPLLPALSCYCCNRMASARNAEAIFIRPRLSGPAHGTRGGVQSLIGGNACPTGVFSDGECVKSNISTRGFAYSS